MPVDDALTWDSNRSTMDFMQCVRARIGLDAAIPLEANHLWMVTLDLLLTEVSSMNMDAWASTLSAKCYTLVTGMVKICGWV